jgi:hypothetical protein
MHPDNSAWCFDPGLAGEDHSTPATLTKLGRRVGDEQVSKVPYPPGSVTGAEWLNTGDLVVAGDAELLVTTYSGNVKYRVPLPNSHPVTIKVVNDRQVISLASDLTLRVSDIPTERQAAIGQMNSLGFSKCLTSEAEDSIYLATRYGSRSGDSRVAIVRVQTTGSWMPKSDVPTTPTRRLAEKSETGQAVPAPESTHVGLASGQLNTQQTPPYVSTDLPTSSDQSAAESRLADQRRGYRDGFSLTATLPLWALEGAVSTNFDVVRWLQPWREGWRLIATGQAPAHVSLVDWLPTAAQMLGVYAAPVEVLESHFTPSAAYVIGFSNGMRAAWDTAIKHRIVPRDSRLLSEWLQQPVDGRSRVKNTSRSQITLKELRAASIKTRIRNAWTRIGGVTLWLATGFFSITAIAAVAITATDGWPTHNALFAIYANLLFDVPLAGLIALVIYDVRRLRKKSRSG